MNPVDTLPFLRGLHDRIRDAVVAACEAQAVEDLSAVAHDEEGDTIYAVDRVSEELLIEAVTEELATQTPVVLVAEGIEGGQIVLPHGADESAATLRIIVDPIDGTRGLMYQKRPAWILTGVAPNKGPDTTLADIEVAVMTEIPLVRQHQSDTLWAIRGQGAHGERYDRIRGETHPITLRPSTATSIAHGFAQVSRFFPGARAELATIDDAIVRQTLGPIQPGKAQCFEDQYICTGGQLYEIIIGHDRFVADLRPLMEPLLAARGVQLGICCHPYDLCTEMIAREVGAPVCSPDGSPLSARLDVDSDVAWVAYANEGIRAQVEPALRQALTDVGAAI
ncbi:MAG: inositol monophosphatase [Gemmatimonadetes bacterium]|nr:inositol monophosphatase [Gemmatimonadota bacterium]MBT6145032.1 inositol monophosphatase [Gemmatimonadota bacterium]MBT7858858.1 inositol monophosphatase [Gemmatimonadota bacterium]